MKMIETKISDVGIQMRYANNASSQEATQWIEFLVPLASLRGVSDGSGAVYDLKPVETRKLETIRDAALRYVQEAIARKSEAAKDRSRFGSRAAYDCNLPSSAGFDSRSTFQFPAVPGSSRNLPGFAPQFRIFEPCRATRDNFC